jgi:two-component system, response regulator PdtaR
MGRDAQKISQAPPATSPSALQAAQKLTAFSVTQAQLVRQPDTQGSDEVLIRSLLSEELREAGFCVIEAAHAEEAMSYLQAGGDVDLVFTDVRMPGSRSVLDVARDLRGQYPLLPIILTSGNERPPGADTLGPFIPKPYKIDYAVSVVRELLSRDRPDEPAGDRDNE